MLGEKQALLFVGFLFVFSFKLKHISFMIHLTPQITYSNTHKCITLLFKLNVPVCIPANLTETNRVFLVS